MNSTVVAPRLWLPPDGFLAGGFLPLTVFSVFLGAGVAPLAPGWLLARSLALVRSSDVRSRLEERLDSRLLSERKMLLPLLMPKPESEEELDELCRPDVARRLPVEYLPVSFASVAQGAIHGERQTAATRRSDELLCKRFRADGEKTFSFMDISSSSARLACIQATKMPSRCRIGAKTVNGPISFDDCLQNLLLCGAQLHFMIFEAGLRQGPVIVTKRLQ